MRTVRLLPVSPSMHCSRGEGEAGTPLWTEWQTGVNILPCPKLRLRAVNILVIIDSDVIAYCRVPVMYCKQPFIDDSKFKIDQFD